MRDPTVLSALITAAAAFVGVALAEGVKFLTSRRAESQAELSEVARARKELLLAYRAFRRHLMQIDVTVELEEEVTGDQASKQHVVIHPAAEQWHRADSAWVDFHLTDPPPDLLTAAEELRAAWYDFARVRALYSPGTIPSADLDLTRKAEARYLEQLRRTRS